MGASAGFEHEEGDSLLDEQTDDNGPPLDDGSVPRRHPETRLEHDETHDGDRAIAIFRALRGERKKESGAASGVVKQGPSVMPGTAHVRSRA